MLGSSKKDLQEMGYLQFHGVRMAELKEQHPDKTNSQLRSIIKREWQTQKKEIKTAIKNSSAKRFSSGMSAERPSGQGENIQQQGPNPRRRLEFSDKKTSARKSTDKKKSIKKQRVVYRRQEYLDFYKTYYQKLHQEHPRWSPQQLTDIVVLLWRKKLSTQLRHPIINRFLRLRQSPISGRQAFYEYMNRKYHQRHSTEYLDGMWRRLPQESKKYWDDEGQKVTGVEIERKVPQKRIFTQDKSVKSQAESTSPNSLFSFMNHISL